MFVTVDQVKRLIAIATTGEYVAHQIHQAMHPDHDDVEGLMDSAQAMNALVTLLEHPGLSITLAPNGFIQSPVDQEQLAERISKLMLDADTH